MLWRVSLTLRLLSSVFCCNCFASCSHCWVFFGVLLGVVVECNTDGNILVVDPGMI
jgi:hypothetical protein